MTLFFCFVLTLGFVLLRILRGGAGGSSGLRRRQPRSHPWRHGICARNIQPRIHAAGCVAGYAAGAADASTPERRIHRRIVNKLPLVVVVLAFVFFQRFLLAGNREAHNRSASKSSVTQLIG